MILFSFIRSSGFPGNLDELYLAGISNKTLGLETGEYLDNLAYLINQVTFLFRTTYHVVLPFHKNMISWRYAKTPPEYFTYTNSYQL